jgi:2-phosphoglycolate phosphatase
VSARRLPVRGVLFDLDGTLADTACDLAAALNAVRRARGLGELPLEHLRPHASHGARGLIGAGFGLAPGDAGFEDLRDLFHAAYEAALCVHTRPFEGVAETLAELARRGLSWGIVTNKASRFTLPLLAQVDFGLPPACVVCGDTTPRSKPHPEPLFEAARRLGLPPGQCVYVGDAERDVQAGLAAGMATLAATYGYLRDDEDPVAWNATGLVAHPSALLDWLPREDQPGGQVVAFT